MENAKTKEQEVSTIIQESKKIGIISYLTIIGLIIAIVMNNNKKSEFASYHIRQTLGLAISGLTLMVIGFIPILGWITNIIGFFILLYMWVIGLVNVINAKFKPVPFLGKKFEVWFKNI